MRDYKATMSVLTIVSIFSLLVGAIVHADVNIEGRITELEKLAERQSNENKALRARAGHLEETLDQLKSLQCKTHVDHNTDIPEGTHSDIGAGNRMADVLDYIQKRQGGSNHVAFHAYQSLTKTYYTHENILFDVEVVDEPMHSSTVSGYSPTSGIFDAPTSGVYVLTWTVTAPPTGARFITELMVNGNNTTSTTSDSDYNNAVSGGNGVHPSTAVYVTHLSAGTHVSVRILTTGPIPSVSVKSDAEVRATFSGWLLF